MADEIDSVQWRAIPDFPDYEVSSRGSVRRVVASTNGSTRKVPFNVTPQPDERGRKRVGLVNAETAPRQKKLLISRLVAEAFIGPSPSPKHVVCHNDGNNTRDHADNLRWDTQKSNIADKVIHGTVSRGSRNGLSKLLEADIPKIREMLRLGVSQMKIAEAFGIDQTSVSLIKNRRIWQHVE